MKMITIEHKGRMYESVDDIPDNVILDMYVCLWSSLIAGVFDIFMKRREESKLNRTENARSDNDEL